MMNPFKKHATPDEYPEANVISFIASDFVDGNQEIEESRLEESIPLLPLRNTIVFPGSTLPISVGRRDRKSVV